MVSCPQELRASYRDGRLLPFIGAGVSRSISWTDSGGQLQYGPTWSELVNKATELLGFQSPELARVRGTDLQILEYFKQTQGEQIAQLTNWLARLMSPPDEALKYSPILLELSRLQFCNLIYTTNYDDFIEKALRLNGKDARSIVLESHMARNVPGVEVVKFHGDLNHPDQIVLTESDYERRLTLQDPLDSRLLADLLGRAVLFLGYSFRDPNVSYLFRKLYDRRGNRPSGLGAPIAYIAIPDPSDFEFSLFRNRHIDVIPLRGARMTEDIADLLKQLRN